MIVLRVLLWFVGAIALQWYWNTHLSFWGAAPQFLLAFTVLVASRRGPIPAMLFGFFWGLFADAMRADLFGASALLYTAAGYAAGMARRQIDLRGAGSLAVAVLLLSFGCVVVYGALGSIFSASFAWLGWAPALLAPFMNSLVAVLGAGVWDARETRRGDY